MQKHLLRMHEAEENLMRYKLVVCAHNLEAYQTKSWERGRIGRKWLQAQRGQRESEKEKGSDEQQSFEDGKKLANKILRIGIANGKVRAWKLKAILGMSANCSKKGDIEKF